ncbi:hypothetical protein EW145_g2380 [Phellinidium pouzarii]|uniref:Uncharacterized protein n=1 Tax=Phellinidium pouzarii TaxID=167371 RepID=A0A4S4LB23_9AGAM|nr:hypothetical protein EW145_g2380 [Phellinidium pouzarii]
MRYCVAAIFVFLCAALVRAQTQTVTDAFGDTVVEAITLNPAGLATTQTLETLTLAAATTAPTTTTTPVTTTTPATTTAPTRTTTPNQGPVGQPPATTGTGQTIFTYTTTDVDGDTTLVVATFTPTFNTVTVLPTQTFTGTVLGFSSWLSLVGTNTVASDLNASSAHVGPVAGKVWGIGAALLVSALGGAWLAIG